MATVVAGRKSLRPLGVVLPLGASRRPAGAKYVPKLGTRPGRSTANIQVKTLDQSIKRSALRRRERRFESCRGHNPERGRARHRRAWPAGARIPHVVTIRTPDERLAWYAAVARVPSKRSPTWACLMAGPAIRSATTTSPGTSSTPGSSACSNAAPTCDATPRGRVGPAPEPARAQQHRRPPRTDHQSAPRLAQGQPPRIQPGPTPGHQSRPCLAVHRGVVRRAPGRMTPRSSR
jgi:hypothetical protein